MLFSEYLIEQFDLDEKSTLNSKIWDGTKMKKDVRSALEDIADAFIKFVDCPDMKVIDVTMTGSLANYTWHGKSDVDLHIIVDITKVKNSNVFTQMFSAKKGLWNAGHDIEIKDFPVELYVQLSTEPHKSTGVYSITKNEWIVRPKKSHPSINDSYIIHKADKWKEQIDHIIDHKINNLPSIEKLKIRLRDMRKMGLDKDGEFSAENLAFKILRNDGYIEKLYNYATKLQDEELSLD